MSKKTGCAVGLVLGSALRLLVLILEFLIRLVANLLVFFGLWVPFLYSLLGLGLFFLLDFNPLDWTLEGQLYLAGLAVCLICSVIITVRNLILRPAKSVFKGFKEPLWKKEKRQNDKVVEAHPVKNLQKAIKENVEDVRPKIYYSALEENTLIHEYADRFEIFHLQNNHAKLDRIEYKDYDERQD